MSHERGQRTPGTPGKDAAAVSSPTKKKMEYMTGVMPPGIKKCQCCRSSPMFFPSLSVDCVRAGIIVYQAPEPIKAPEKNPLCKTVTDMPVTLTDGTIGKCAFSSFDLSVCLLSRVSSPIGTQAKSRRLAV